MAVWLNVILVLNLIEFWNLQITGFKKLDALVKFYHFKNKICC